MSPTAQSQDSLLRPAASTCNGRGLLLREQAANPFGRHLIHDVAFEPADRNRVAFVTRSTTGFATVGTDAAADSGEGVALIQQLINKRVGRSRYAEKGSGSA